MVSTRPFLVVDGDIERALVRRAKTRGPIDVIFGLGFPSNLTPEQREEALFAEDEMIADLAIFDVEILPGTSVGSLSVRANFKALRFLIEDRRVERLRQRRRPLLIEDLRLRHRRSLE